MQIKNNIYNWTHTQAYIYILKLIHKTTNEELYYVGQSKLNLSENKNYAKGTWCYGFNRLSTHVKIDGSISEAKSGVDRNLEEAGLDPKDFVCATAELLESEDPKNDEFAMWHTLKSLGYNVINSPTTIYPKRVQTRPGFVCSCCSKVIPPGTQQCAKKSIVVYRKKIKLPDGIKICTSCYDQTVRSKSFGSDKKSHMNSYNNQKIQKWLLKTARIDYTMSGDLLCPILP